MGLGCRRRVPRRGGGCRGGEIWTMGRGNARGGVCGVLAHWVNHGKAWRYCDGAAAMLRPYSSVLPHCRPLHPTLTPNCTPLYTSHAPVALRAPLPSSSSRQRVQVDVEEHDRRWQPVQHAVQQVEDLREEEGAVEPRRPPFRIEVDGRRRFPTLYRPSEPDLGQPAAGGSDEWLRGGRRGGCQESKSESDG